MPKYNIDDQFGRNKITIHTNGFPEIAYKDIITVIGYHEETTNYWLRIVPSKYSGSHHDFYITLLEIELTAFIDRDWYYRLTPDRNELDINKYIKL